MSPRWFLISLMVPLTLSLSLSAQYGEDEWIEIPLHPKVAVANDGTFVVVTSDREHVFAQRYRWDEEENRKLEDGERIEVQRDMKTIDRDADHKNHTVAMYPNGRFVVAWESSGRSHASHVRVFNRDGNVSGDRTEFNRLRPAVALVPGQDSLVALTYVDIQLRDVFVRLYRGDMGPQTRIPLQRKERRLWTSVVSAVNCNTLVVAAEEIDSLQVFIARITINPMKVCEIAVLENARNPAIAANSNGNCVVVWEDISDSSEIAVKLASLISDHSKLDEPFKVVNTGKVNIADNIADVDINNNGDIAVVYTDTARVDRVFSKRYCFSEGSISPGDRLMISRDTEDRPQAHHRSPSVAMRANNSYVVAWESVLRDEENLLHTRPYPKSY